jgi:hypothetical protein
MLHDIGSTGAMQNDATTGVTIVWIVQSSIKPFVLPFSPPPEGQQDKYRFIN